MIWVHNKERLNENYETSDVSCSSYVKVKIIWKQVSKRTHGID